jgi:hypothetical protein
MKAEARARLAAEADLLRRRKAEFERLRKAKDRNAAIVALIEKHSTEYGDLVKAHRARFEAAGTAA